MEMSAELKYPNDSISYPNRLSRMIAYPIRIGCLDEKDSLPQPTRHSRLSHPDNSISYPDMLSGWPPMVCSDGYVVRMPSDGVFERPTQISFARKTEPKLNLG